MEIINNALKEFGLDEKEVQIYLTCLELGQNSAGEISRKSNIQRELTYVILKRLKEKGIVSQTIKDKKKYFEVVPPESLIQKIEVKKDLLKKALPKLNFIKKSKSSLVPKIQTFEGAEGIKSIFSKIINFYDKEKTQKILYGYGSAGKFENFLKWSLPHFINERVKRKIIFKAVYSTNEESKQKKNLPLSKIKFLPQKFESASFYFIYKNHVAIFIFSEEPVGILIESEEIYKSHISYFDIIWKTAKS